MSETSIYTDHFNIQDISFDLGLTYNSFELPFMEMTEHGPDTLPGTQMSNFSRSLFLALIWLFPENVLKFIFSKKQPCRNPVAFYGYNYHKNDVLKLGFVQVMENYKTPEHKLFIFTETILTSDFFEKWQNIIKTFEKQSEQYSGLYSTGSELKDFQMHCEVANILYNKELIEESLIEYRISLKMKKNNAHAIFGIANVYESMGNKDKALKYYEKTRDINPDHPDINRKLGDFYHKYGEQDKALEEYSRVIELTTDSLISGYSHFSIGIINEGKHKLKKAVSEYKKAIKDRPDYDFAYFKLAQIYINKDEPQKAVKYLEKAISLRPNNFLYYDNLAIAYSKADETDRAIWAYKIALKLNENDIRTLLNLGFMYSRKGDFKHAILTYKKALSINPDNPEIYFYIGLAYVTHNMPLESALNFYEKAVSLDSRHINSRNQIGLIYYLLKDYRKAIKEFEICIRYEPGFILAYKNLGLIYQELEKYENAIDYYSKAIDLGENDFECYYNRGIAYFSKENWISSIDDFKKALTLRSEKSEEIEKLLADAERKRLIEDQKYNS